MKSRGKHGWLMSGVGTLLIFTIWILPLLGKLNAAPQWQTKVFKKGDALRLTVWVPMRLGDGKNQNLDINGEYPIDSRGVVFFPLIGDFKVVGHNSITLAEELKEKYSGYFQDPIIIAIPLIRITMLGAFRRPGTYLIPSDASFWELVDKAGGPDDDSDLKKMWIERGGKIVKKNLLSGFEKGYSLQELGIYSGDQILVASRKHFRLRDALEILRFSVTILNIYFLITKLGEK